MRACPVVLLLLLAGCSDAPAPEAAPEPTPSGSTAPEPEPTVEVVVTDISWDGRTKEGFFVCSDPQGTQACAAGQQVQPDGQHTRAFPYPGVFTEADLEVTWTPADPSQTGLVVAVYANTTSGSGTLMAVAEGSGSLSIQIINNTLLPDDALTVIAWPSAKVQQSPSVFVDATRQPFHVAGGIVSILAPAPS